MSDFKEDVAIESDNETLDEWILSEVRNGLNSDDKGAIDSGFESDKHGSEGAE
jgi:hypothetical protein